jgi:hypothetical protein
MRDFRDDFLNTTKDPWDPTKDPWDFCSCCGHRHCTCAEVMKNQDNSFWLLNRPAGASGVPYAPFGSEMGRKCPGCPEYSKCEGRYCYKWDK